MKLWYKESFSLNDLYQRSRIHKNTESIIQIFPVLHFIISVVINILSVLLCLAIADYHLEKPTANCIKLFQYRILLVD